MQKKLVIQEHISSVWKKVIIISLLGMAAFFGLYMAFEHPLWKGIFRLLAFAGFAALVLGSLQIRGPIPKIELQIDPDHLIVNYYRSSKKSQEEFFELKTIDTIEQKTAPPAWKVLPRRDSKKFIISFTDSKKKLSLFRFEGRDILISKPDARKAKKFLTQNFPEQVI